LNNYFPKNIKASLTPAETVLLEYDLNCLETVILGGCVSNISNINKADIEGVTDYFTLKILNTQTQETTLLFSEIPIVSNSVFPFDKIHLNEYNQLIATSVYSNNLQLTLSYFYVMNYDNGVVKINFTPSQILTFSPNWNLLNQEIYYNNYEYVPVPEGVQTFQFDTILGWEKPSDVDIYIQRLKTTNITANYVLTDSTVTFFVSQPDLIDIFKWRLVGETIWLSNNELLTLPSGTHEFEFESIDVYYKPDNITLITEGKLFYSNEISYLRIKEYVTVNIDPQTLQTGLQYYLTNQWRLIYPNNSFSDWYNSGESVLFNINDNYTLEIMDNTYLTAEENNINFNLVQNTPVLFNINMLFNLVSSDNFILEDIESEILVFTEE
jgi:hypothetical protein